MGGSEEKIRALFADAEKVQPHALVQQCLCAQHAHIAAPFPTCVRAFVDMRVHVYAFLCVSLFLCMLYCCACAYRCMCIGASRGGGRVDAAHHHLRRDGRHHEVQVRPFPLPPSPAPPISILPRCPHGPVWHIDTLSHCHIVIVITHCNLPPPLIVVPQRLNPRLHWRIR